MSTSTQRGPIERALVGFASSRFGGWYFVNVSSRWDPWLLKRSNGRFSSVPGQPVLVLVHTGAKSGRRRETALLYVTDGNDIVLVGSKAGATKNPAWYHNLVAHPDCELIVKDRSGRYRARQAAGEERERLWRLANDLYPGYDTYQTRTDRTIPVLVLEPAA